MPHLPPSVENIIRLIGLPKTQRLVEQLGGTSFPVAKAQTKLGQIRYELLAEVVGTTAADQLTAEYGGEVLYIPNCKAAARAARDAAIHARFDQLVRELSSNEAVSLLAREYQLSDRRVWDILKVLPEASNPQGVLF